MSGVYDNHADAYLDARPTYPSDWFSKLAGLSLRRNLAWDAGTGNGQAAIGVADQYDRVIATDVSETMLKFATPHPKVTYHHTPPSMTDEEMLDLIGGENSVDLITVATAVHWFDLPSFYALATRLLRKPGGIIAVWSYSTEMVVNPDFDSVLSRFHDQTLPYCKFPQAQYFLDGYKTLPFPFESVGFGSEGEPVELEMKKTVSFEGLLRMLRSWSSVETAKQKGVDLLPENVVKELETAWGGVGLVRTVVYKSFMLVGTVGA
ncbi:PREDICTED: putative methyltransferase DDB_G0268948 [Tarenaya hassleriana]|uniref:putative methyltransferase DDB_G0268948 n=1 Tax=Tarenaya hassleriana TaxID=28532 RepID=UPI00053C77ED|nr:PREDICTED: putative methyltransferase DDB_G0268948 [Tarenaya hassleriana]